MTFKKQKIIYFAFYGGYFLYLLINAILYGQYDIIDVTYIYIFPLLLATILISFVAFLSTMFSSDKFEDYEYRFLLIMHGSYFVIAMLIYRILFWY